MLKESPTSPIHDMIMSKILILKGGSFEGGGGVAPLHPFFFYFQYQPCVKAYIHAAVLQKAYSHIYDVDNSQKKTLDSSVTAKLKLLVRLGITVREKCKNAWPFCSYSW